MQPSNTICAHDRLRCFENAVVGQKYCTNHLKENKVDVNKLDLKLCGYVSGRTLLQCTNFRREEQLDKNGFCEQHINYIKRLKSDLERTRRLLDPGLKKEPRDFIDQDEEETLDVDGDWPYTMDSAYCDSRVADDDDDPLRNAGVFTHKEIIKRQIAALEREKQALLEFHELLAERLRRLDLKHAKQVKFGKKKKKAQQVIKEEEKLYVDAQNAALAKYGSHINWKSVENFLGKCDEKKKLLENPLEKDSGGAEVKSKCALLERQPGYCSHFELVKVKKLVRMSPKIKQAAEPLEFNDFESRLCLDNMFSSLGINPPITEPDAQIKSLVNIMLDEIERSETESIIGGQENDQIEIEVKHFCPYKMLPLSDFCAGHILEDQKQFVYSKCSEVGCTQICFVYENACTIHAKATPPPRPRRKAILSVDSLSNIPSSSELRPRSYTDVQLQPSTSSGFPINFPMGGEPKGILRRGRPPNQPPKMLPFLAKPGQIIGSPTNFIVTSTGQSSPQGFITVPATPRTPLLSPKIVSKKPLPKNRDDSSSDEDDSGKPVRRVVIDSSEDEEIEAKKPRIENAIDESIDSVASQSFSQPTVPGHGSRRFKTPWAKKAESLHIQPLSSLPLVQAAPNKPQFRNNVLPPPGQATPNMGQKGQMMKSQPQGRQLFQNSDETCARVQPFSGRKDKTKETGTAQKNNNGSTVEPGTYDRLLQNSGMDMNSPVFATPSNVRYTPVAQQQPRFISHSAEAGGYGYSSSQTQVNAKLTYGRVKPASQLMSGTNLSNVPPNVQTPFKAADQKYSTQQTPSPEQQHQPQNVSTQSSLPQTHIPAEHDYTSFRQPQPRIRQPSIRRIQYNMPVNSEFQPRSTTLYRTRYPNPRARIITVPTPAQFNPIRHQRAIGPRTISLHPVNSNNASGISPSTNINAQNIGAAANNNMQSQTGAPIYVNGGKQIYLKGIDIGSIQNVHTARYAPTNIVTKRRIIADGVITHQHPIKQPRKQQFQTTGTTGTYNHFSRTLDTIPSYPPHHNSTNHHDQNVENSSLPINVNPQTLQYQQLQPIVETKSPPVGLTPQQILAHDHDFSFSKLPSSKETLQNGPNSETNNALEMLADVSVSQGRRTSTSCGLEDEADD